MHNTQNVAALIPLDIPGRRKQLSLVKFRLLILSSCWLLVGCASEKACCPSSGNAGQIAGEYTGDWTNSDGGNGTLRITLKKPANAPWQGNLTFTSESDEAATTMKSVEVNGTQIRMDYDYKIREADGAVEMTGKLDGNGLQGTYIITKGDGSPGTWKASRTP